MACRYCFVAPAVRGRPLSLEAVTSAMEYFLKSGDGVNGVRKITFMGGEPFLHFKLLCQSIDYIRSRMGPDSLAVEVFTNGTLLDPDKLKFLESRNVSLTLSIDGSRLTNDLHRVFNRQNSSAFEKAIPALGVDRRYRPGVHMIVTPETAGKLVRNVDFFFRRGASRISFTPVFGVFWPGDKIAVLKKSLDGFLKYYAFLTAQAGRRLPFEIGNIYEFMRPAEWSRTCSFRRCLCQTLTLGWDGYFYACDKSFSKHGAELAKDRVGSIDSGVDWKRRELQYARAFKWATGHGWKTGKCFSCPMGVYFSSRGASMLDNFQDVSGVYDSAMKRLACRLKDDPLFRRVHHFHGLERNT